MVYTIKKISKFFLTSKFIAIAERFTDILYEKNIYYDNKIMKEASSHTIETKYRTSLQDVYLYTEYKSTANSLLTIAARYKKCKVGTFYISF